MINDLPQLFGRNFLVGFVLPAALTALAVAGVLDLYGHTAIYEAVGAYLGGGDTSDKLPVGRLGLAALAIWTFAVFLLGVNDPLTRLLEGYGTLNPARLWRWYSVWRFRGLTRVKLDNAAGATDGQKTAYRNAYKDLAEYFPEEERVVLPTRFGNILRAAERYCQTIYDIAPIATWPRLQSVTPQAHLDSLADAKASMDFWINLWCGGGLVAAVALAARWHPPHPLALRPGLLIVCAALLFSVAMAKLAQSAAYQYGALVKTAFDLYRGALADQLGLQMPQTLADERKLWNGVSRAFIYHNPKAAADLDAFRKAPGAKDDDGGPKGVRRLRRKSLWRLLLDAFDPVDGF